LFELQTKQKKAALVAKEEEELFQLVDYIEDLEAKRLKHMIALARLKSMTLEELREKMGIPSFSIYA